MHSFLILLKKEWKEQFKDYRMLWLPIIFIGVGVMHPITLKLLPELIGGNSQGIIIDPNAPIPSGNEVYAGIFSQLNQFGLLIVAITLMGCIVKEEQSGILDILFSKPVNTGSYLISKYFLNVIVCIVSMLIGSLAGMYYTNMYYSSVDFNVYGQAMFLYGVWFLFIVTLSVTASAIAKTQIQAAAISIIIPIIMLILGNSSHVLSEVCLPSSLSKNAMSIMMGNKIPSTWILNVAATLALVACMYAVSYVRMRYKRRN